MIGPRAIVLGTTVRLPVLEEAAEANRHIVLLTLRTLARGEMTGGGDEFLTRLPSLDFPNTLSHDECNRDLVLLEAMRGGYPSGPPTNGTTSFTISSERSARRTCRS